MISEDVKTTILRKVSFYMDADFSSEELERLMDEYLQHQGNDVDTYREELQYAIQLINDHSFRL